MTWAKLDDRMHDDPRTEAAGVEAMGLWAMALSYMADYATDGRISLARCRRLAGSQKGKRYADRLVEAGWWEPHEDGYRLIDWTSYLIPREQVEARSAGAVEAGRRGGRARADAAKVGGKVEPRSGVRSAPVPEPCPGSLSGNVAEALDTSQPTPAPDPDPIPTQPDSAHAGAPAHARDGAQGQDQRPTVAFAPSSPPAFALTPPEPEPPAKAKKAPATGKGSGKATTFPEGWRPSPAHVVFAREKRVNLADEAGRFEDNAKAKGLAYIDWDAAFRTWIRNARKFADERAARASFVPTDDDLDVDAANADNPWHDPVPDFHERPQRPWPPPRPEAPKLTPEQVEEQLEWARSKGLMPRAPIGTPPPRERAHG